MIYNLERLKKTLKTHDLDAIIAATRENILYFTGFNPVIKTLNSYYGQCYAVITRVDLKRVNIVHSLGEVDQLLDSVVPLGLVHCYGRFYREYLSSKELTFDHCCQISDQEAISMCHLLARERGILMGGSGGIVVCGALKYLHQTNVESALALLPDTGVNYLDQIYDQDWLSQKKIKLLTTPEIVNKIGTSTIDI